MSDEPSPSFSEVELRQRLSAEMLSANRAREEVIEHVSSLVARLTIPPDAATWRKNEAEVRQKLLEEVVFRGVPAEWRDARGRVEWQGAIESGDGLRIRKLRLEAIPGLWVPALLYEPTGSTGKLAVSLQLNGHDAAGKAAPYKQALCLNLAHRGVLTLNIEWIGMGQLRVPGNAHGKLNQLDLCGAAGLAPFFLVMQRGLDVLLEHPQADPSRVAVAGLSGGGWQTIFLSALDPRVTVANPVAGYSSFLTRVQHHSDLGDSEQTPCDMARIADYTHLTALRAPRPTLLTYNAKDECCFASGHALAPLMAAAEPVFALLGHSSNLRFHVNRDPGTHNFERENREVLYQTLSEHGFGQSGRPFPREEMDVAAAVRTADELRVELPAENMDLHQLAMGISRSLPRTPAWPEERMDIDSWRRDRQKVLREVVRWPGLVYSARKLAELSVRGQTERRWLLRLNDQWTVPVMEFEPASPQGTTLLVAQQGRASLAADVARVLSQGQRAVVLDVTFCGECEIRERAYLFQLLVASVGSRSLGIQAAQIAAVAEWLRVERGVGPAGLLAKGSRTSVAALVAAAMQRDSFTRVHIHEGLGTLREVIDNDLSFEQAPELFCFGLLAEFDLRGIAALAAPTPITWVGPSQRAREELESLSGWYARLGTPFSPLAPP